MSLQVTWSELLRWASPRGAKNENIAGILGCSSSTVSRWKAEPSPWKIAFLLAAASRCLDERGRGGFQTTLMHFTGTAQ